MELFSRYAKITLRRGIDLPLATSVKFYTNGQNSYLDGQIPPIVGQAPSIFSRKGNYKSVDAKQREQKTQATRGLPSISPLRHYSGLHRQKTLLYYQFNYGQETPEVQSYKIFQGTTNSKSFTTTHSSMKLKKEKIRYASQLKQNLFVEAPETTTSKPQVQSISEEDKIANNVEKLPEEPQPQPIDEEKEAKQKKLEEKLKKDPILIRDLQQLFEIHCVDQDRKMKYDFYCDKNVLTKHILYFQKKKYLKDEVLSDLDISIFCEVKIFSWLMRYIRWKEYSQNPHQFDEILEERKLKTPHKPQITKERSLSILVSSHFLNIPELYEESSHFVREHLGYLIKHKYQFDLINKEIVKKLASLCEDSEIYALQDPSDRLKSRLYEYKLQKLLSRDERNQLYRCVYCSRLFTLQQREEMSCEKAKIFIDYRGNVISQHVADRDFDLQGFIVSLRSKNWSWQKIYLNFCPIFVHFNCIVCNSKFVSSEIKTCAWHPKPAAFMTGSNIGKFPCCGQNTMRFSTASKKTGCQFKFHVINEKAADSQQANFIMKIASELELSNASDEASGSPISLLQQSLSHYMEEKLGNKNEEEDSEAHYLSEDQEEEDQPIAQRNLKNYKPASEIGAVFNSVAQSDKVVSSVEPSVWRTDCIRDNDKLKMRELMEKLIKCRDNEIKATEPVVKRVAAPQRTKVAITRTTIRRNIKGTGKYWK